MSYEGYSTDEGKRKRTREDEMFRNSTKTERSPIKTRRSNDEKMDMMLNMMKDIKMDMQNVKTEMQGVKSEIQDIKSDTKGMRREQREFRDEMKILKMENEKLVAEHKKIKKENEEIRKELSNIKRDMNWLEKQKRGKNVVITGLQMDHTEENALAETLNKVIEKHLEIKVQIKEAHKLGPNICLIELDNIQDKNRIMQNKQKLNKLKDERIFINHDLTKVERYMQKQIRARAHEERQKGKTAQIGFSKVIIEGQEWRWNKDRERLETAKN